MAKRYSKSSPLIFEELEPRLLFSADIAEALVVDAIEQSFVEEPAVTANMEPAVEQSTVSVQMPVEVEDESSTLPGKSISVAVDPPIEKDGTVSTGQLTSEHTVSPPKVEETEPATALEQSYADTAAGSEITGTTTNAEVGTTVSESEETAAVPVSQELILINSNAHNTDLLVDDINQNDSQERSLEVVVLDSKLDGIDQVTDTLSEYEDLDAIHFITHGRDGYLSIGNDWLSKSDLQDNGDIISDWGKALNEVGDILLYGCSIADGENGKDFIDSLAKLTGADVTASDDPSGSAALGGDWDLEYESGTIETDAPLSENVQQRWENLLVSTVQDNFNTIAFDGNDGTVPWSNDWQEIGEADGADAGNISIYQHLNFGSEQVLSLWKNDVGVWREADISGATSATLSFDYGLYQLDLGDSVSVEISTDGGASWSNIATFSGVASHTSLLSASYDITPYIDNDTRIKFETSNFGDNDEVVFDNILIELEPRTLTVTTVNDIINGDTSSISALTTTPGTDGISLREAIIAANNTAGLDRIYFDITGPGQHTIAVENVGLPEITDAIIIDGTTQQGYAGVPIIELDGSLATNADGLVISSGSSTIRGLVFNRFDNAGIYIHTGDGNIIEHNYIGTDLSGSIDQGNSADGIIIENSSNNLIGGSTEEQRNLISGNAGAGLYIDGSLAFNNIISGNFIGSDVTGSNSIANSTGGILLDNWASFNVIGGTVEGSSNLIAYNNGPGVVVSGTLSNSNAILGNAIHSNSGLGIDLNNDGVSLNDSGDSDVGPNYLRNYPVITAVSQNGADLDISFNLEIPDYANDYRIEFFENPGGIDGSGHGSGEVFLGSVNVASSGSGSEAFRAPLSGVTATNLTSITATATLYLGGSSYGSTSEFSPATTAIAALSPVKDTYLDNNNKLANYGDSANLAVEQFTAGIGDERSLLQFDLSSIPAGATITSATLQLNATANSGTFPVNVYQVTENWQEGSGGDGVANWNHRLPSIPWGAAGGSVDFTILATLETDSTGTHSWDITALAQEWFSDSSTNYGLMLGNFDMGSESVTYDSREGEAPPELIITYTPLATHASTASGEPYRINEGEDLAILDGSQSSDPEGDPLTYTWDLDNDGAYDDATGATPTVNWATLQGLGIIDNDTYTIGLQVDDGKGNTDTTSTTLTVNNAPPTIAATGDSTVSEGTPFTLNLSASDPGDDTITGWTINWGDGTVENITGNPGSVTHVYTNAGFTNNITLSAEDEDGTHIPGDLLITSMNSSSLFRFNASTTAFEQEFANSDGLANPIAVKIGPDGLIYVSGYVSGDIHRYDAGTGAYVDQFDASDPVSRITFGPDGNLYASSLDTDEVLQLDIGTGTFTPFVMSNSGMLNETGALAFGPDSNLYVVSNDNGNIIRYDGATGEYIDIFANGGATGYSEILFGPDGHLYFSNVNANKIVRFDGTTGAYIDDFVTTGSGSIDGTDGFCFGPDGDLYVAGFNDNQVYRFSGTDGSFKNVVISDDAGLDRPISPIFTPVHQVTVLSNQAPKVTLTNTVTALTEDTNTTSVIKVADIVISDDLTGTNNLTLTGADAGLFSIVGTELLLNAGISLDYETNPSLDVTVAVDDTTVGLSPDDTADLSIAVIDVNEPPAVTLTNEVTALPEDTDTTSAIKVADIVISDDLPGTNNLTLTGADAGLFSIVGTELFLNAGLSLDYETNPSLDITVAVDDITVGLSPDDTADLSIAVTDVNEAPTITGDDTGQVTEDNDPDFDALIETFGALTIVDLDAGESSFVSETINGTYGDLIINAAGDWSYRANNNQIAIQQLDAGQSISDSLTVTSADGTTHTITITINGADDSPVLQNSIPDQAASENTPFTFSFATNTFDDVDISDSLIYTATLDDDSPLPSWLNFDGITGTFSGTPLDTDIGLLSIKVTADDGTSTASDIFILTVVNTNNIPNASDDTAETTENTTATTTNVLSNDDLGDAPGMISGFDTTTSLGGTVVYNNDGTFTYTPAAGFIGTDTFTYTISDSDGETSSGTVTITVNQAAATEADTLTSFEPETESAVVEPAIPEPVEPVPPATVQEQQPIRQPELTGEYIEPVVTEEPVDEPDNQPAVTHDAKTDPPVADQKDIPARQTRQQELVEQESSILTSSKKLVDLPQKTATPTIVKSITSSTQPAAQLKKFTFETTSTTLLLDQYLDREQFDSEINYQTAIQQLREALDDFKKEAESEAQYYQTVIGSAIAVSTGLSVGYVLWLIRGGMLLSSVLFSMPAWQIADPLPLLARGSGEEDEDDESLQSIIKKGSSRIQEKRH